MADVCDAENETELKVSSTSEGEVLLRRLGLVSDGDVGPQGSKRTGGGDERGEELGGTGPSKRRVPELRKTEGGTISTGGDDRGEVGIAVRTVLRDGFGVIGVVSSDAGSDGPTVFSSVTSIVLSRDMRLLLKARPPSLLSVSLSLGDDASCWVFCRATASNWACISEYRPFSERKSCSIVSRPGPYNPYAEKCTGMPELVLMPAPVTTTTLRALKRAFATSWRLSSDDGSTCSVGIAARQSGLDARIGETWTGWGLGRRVFGVKLGLFGL